MIPNETKPTNVKREMTIGSAQIRFCEQRIAAMMKAIGERRHVSGDLEARRDELEAYRSDLKKLRQTMQELEIRLDRGPRVTVIQSASEG